MAQTEDPYGANVFHAVNNNNNTTPRCFLPTVSSISSATCLSFHRKAASTPRSSKTRWRSHASATRESRTDASAKVLTRTAFSPKKSEVKRRSTGSGRVRRPWVVVLPLWWLLAPIALLSATLHRKTNLTVRTDGGCGAPWAPFAKCSFASCLRYCVPAVGCSGPRARRVFEWSRKWSVLLCRSKFERNGKIRTYA